MKERRIGVYAGSFDPFTIGHANIVRRALEVVDELHIVLGHNIQKHSFHTVDDRLEDIRGLYADNPRIVVVSHQGIIAQYASQHDAILIRGLRNVADLESERAMAEVNKERFGVETFCLFSESKYSYVSSSLVRELAAFGEDYSEYIPKREEIYGY
ncbi:pantetheine-phosphate adenylyltransferase [Porphyromonas levii]|uniref:Phosphopantetheine adenylyltransferase n=1 Tax=Porphyromonas levii TaxID=28114 RepID=A0A4Y8WQG3_9PORP|nr:pantetheine-phosphate adenylyltransferase [Porphyromonas levii]MBR8702393.1 Phosphopantetheine adenylyltransferase [Porphyromonas levii]MBR8713083.1 Phosphopantetheine adenylyltransferase [Porphyromonas levii]MBR8715113.1 Phosphopantetheine adenylyltransferase [Porphyromonas levii]MBR8727614.1 Phosphopantetheine adenylyltransferase [Porphyromonas levii]MBR8729047.1 Phosphopantetheine adenylyltransferase [Porphyromonas levii]